ncbi:MAG: hypothetical protein JST55_01845 [Bacteroidetes bacterium]|nr:hypothetical protein [Bacteroidota bacterium]
MEQNILDELDNMPEHQKIRKLDQMQYALEIFDGNGIDLSKSIEYGVISENDQVFATHNRHLFMKYAGDLNRYLHNFISSSYTLMSITNNVMSNYEIDSPVFYKEYEEKKMQLTSNPVFNIFFQLRQYVQHIKLIIPSRQFHWDRENGSSRKLLLETDTLISYIEKQTKRSKSDNEIKVINEVTLKYLNNVGGEIDLRNLFEDYIEAVHEFYYWVYSRLKEIHDEDLKKINEKRKEGRKLYIPTILSTNITLYKEGNMGDLDVIFLNTMDSLTYEKIKNEHSDMNERILAMISYIESDVGISSELKKMILGLI